MQRASSNRFGISAGVALPMGDFGVAVGLGFYQTKANAVGGGSFDESNLAVNVGGGYDWGKNFFTELRL